MNSIMKICHIVSLILLTSCCQVFSQATSESARQNTAPVIKKEISIQHHSAAVSSVAFSADGQFIASSAGDRIKLTNLATTKEMLALKPSKEMQFRNVTFSPDGRYLAAGQNRVSGQMTHREGNYQITTYLHYGEVLIWSAQDGSLLQTLSFRGFPAWQIAFSPDNKWLAIGTGPVPNDLTKNCSVELCDGFGEVFLVETKNWKVAKRLQATSQEISLLTFSPDSKFLAGSTRTTQRQNISSSAVSYEIFIWDIASGALKDKLTGHSKTISTLMFSSDGKLLASAGHDHALKIWDMTSGEMVRMISDFTVAYDEMQIETEQSGKKNPKEVNRGVTWLTGIIFHNENKQILASGADGLIRQYDVSTGKILRVIKSQNWPIMDWGAMKADTTFILGVPWRYRYTPFYGRLSSLVLSSDGKAFAAGGADGKVRVFWLE